MGDSGRMTRILAFGTAAAVGLVSVIISWGIPWINPMLTALIAGVVVANTPLAPRLSGAEAWMKTALRIGVCLVGLRLPFGDILELGWSGIAIIVLTVAVTYAATCFIGDRLGLERDLVTLIAAGFAVCGAAAIAAVQDTVRASKESVATALALVTVFGSVLIALVPLLGSALGLSQEQTGVWTGASIHEVAQVLAAASLAGAGAMAAATTVKLGRVALLAGVAMLSTRRASSDAAEDGAPRKRPPILPWFLAGFLFCVVLRSLGVVPDGVLEAGSFLANIALSIGMFGLGLGIKLARLFPLSWRALLLATAATSIALGVSLPFVILSA